MKASTLGFKLDASDDATTLTVPDRYPWLALGLLFLNYVLITMAFTPNHGRESGFELPGLALYGGIVTLSVLVVLCFTNNIRIIRTPRTLVLTRYFLGISRTTEFNLADMRNVRIYGPTRNSKNSRNFQILFDYGKETICLARGLSQPTADLIARKMA